MKHRGRHRRRRRGRALRAVLAGTAFALTAAATMISASQATETDDPGRPVALTSAEELRELTLEREPVFAADADRLTAAMGRPVGVGEVLVGADHTLRGAQECTSDEKRALPAAPAATRAYCFDAADTASLRPGAVTAPGDSADGRWDGERVLLSAWSGPERDGEAGAARLAVVDADDPDHLAYTWALLTVPVDGGRDYRALSSEVTGMVWYGRTLLVTADGTDGRALYVYDVGRVQRADVDGAAVGRVPGGWSAAGARFVLPAVGAYRMPGDVRLGSISLDRSTAPDALVASESVPVGSDRPTRLWRWPVALDAAGRGLPVLDAHGRALPEAAYETKVTGVRGVLANGPDWYVARATGEADGRGMLGRLGTEGAAAAQCGPDGTHQCWSAPAGPLSVADGTGAVWSQAGRMLFSLGLGTIDRSLA
ncbi:hypothetical protein [Streptomyces sp. NPDC057386]|uniref:hypothetical protein n=1 Tax=unclassified Streptomyces TaxID=2593676 RepID=UPI00362ED81C